MAFKKLLFPPVTPSSLPAFDKEKVLRFYFKPSRANSMSQVNHLQLTIARMDNNRTALDPKRYPLGILFKTKSDIYEDVVKKYYYIDIPASEFPLPDIVYKIQVRLGEDNISSMINDSAALGAWLKDPGTLNKISEWSAVTVVMPISPPDFGVQGLDVGIENTISTDGFTFQGYYNPMDETKQEYVTSYRYNLYSYKDPDDTSTWTLLASSGDKYISEFQQVNMDYTFSYEMSENTNYIVTLTVKSKNLFVDTKIYRLITKYYPVLEFFNVIELTPNVDEAKNDLLVMAKQIILREKDSSTSVKFIKDAPGSSSAPGLVATQAIVSGTLVADRSFWVSPIDGSITIQLKTMFNKTLNSMKELIATPTLLITEKPSSVSKRPTFTNIKIGVLKINVAYPTSANLNPAPEWEYRAIVRKETATRIRGVEKVVFDQTRVIKLSDYNPKREYYFYIKETNGLLDIVYNSTYLSSNAEI